jgi:hypothetical protein
MFRLKDVHMHSIQEFASWRQRCSVKTGTKNLKKSVIYLEWTQMAGVPVCAGGQYHGTRFRSVFCSLLEESSQTLYHKQCFVATDGGHFNLYGTACNNSVVSEAASFHVIQRKGQHGIGLSQTWREACHFTAEHTVELYKCRQL